MENKYDNFTISFDDFYVYKPDIHLYRLKHKWMKYIPHFILKLFVKPKIYKNCQPYSIEFDPFSSPENTPAICQTITFKFTEYVDGK